MPSQCSTVRFTNSYVIAPPTFLFPQICPYPPSWRVGCCKHSLSAWNTLSSLYRATLYFSIQFQLSSAQEGLSWNSHPSATRPRRMEEDLFAHDVMATRFSSGCMLCHACASVCLHLYVCLSSAHLWTWKICFICVLFCDSLEERGPPSWSLPSGRGERQRCPVHAQIMRGHQLCCG